MARPSEVCEYCPTADSIEFPTNTNDWTDDYIPRWIKLALPYWKGKRGTRMWYFYLNRNYVDPRFCPVIFMMMWLRASGIKKGPIFPKIRLAGGVGTIKEVVVPFRMKSFQFEQKTMDQWVTEKDALVHMSYDVFCDHK